MKQRIRRKIQKRMLDIDELLVVAVPLYHQNGSWHSSNNPWGPTVRYLRGQMRKLKRRYPRIYYATFSWGDLA